MSEHQDLAPGGVAGAGGAEEDATWRSTSGHLRSSGDRAAGAARARDLGSVGRHAPPPTEVVSAATRLADPLDADMLERARAKGAAIELCKPGEIYEAVRRQGSRSRCVSATTARSSNESLSPVDGELRHRRMGAPPRSTSAARPDQPEGCLVQQIERWTFPPLCEPMPIETPFTFARVLARAGRRADAVSRRGQPPTPHPAPGAKGSGWGRADPGPWSGGQRHGAENRPTSGRCQPRRAGTAGPRAAPIRRLRRGPAGSKARPSAGRADRDTRRGAEGGSGT